MRIFIALMFSATFKKKLERLARDILSDPVRVVQGETIGEVIIFITIAKYSDAFIIV